MGEIIIRKVKGINWKARIAIIVCLTFLFSTFMHEGWYKPRPAHAAVSVYKGSFTKRTSAGAQSITGVGFQPQAVIFFWTKNTVSGTSAANGVMGIGFAGGSPIANASVVTSAQDNVASTNTGWIESATYSIVTLDPATPALAARASVQSFDADGFTLNWQTADASADIIHFIALGGTDITNIKVGQFNGPSAAGSFSYTGVGFQPDFVMLALPDRTSTTLDNVTSAGALNVGMFTSTTQGAIGWGSRDAQSTISHAHILSDAHSVYGIRRNSGDQVATLQSMDANGFTLNFTTAGGTAPYIYIAIKGGQHSIGSFTKRTSAGTQSITGVGFQPTGLMQFSHNSTANNTTVQTADPAAAMSIGASSGSANYGTIWMHDRTVINTDVNMITYTNAVMKMGASNNGITDYGQATLSSFDADGFTLNWSSSDATARRILYWAIGPSPSSDTTPPTDGTLTVTPGDTQNFLSWTPATDNESGLRTTNPYVVVYQIGATPPADCASGTQIYTGSNTSFTHTGLTNGTQYSYRVCAYDNANNVSVGATGSGTPQPPAPWQIQSCSGCHGYKNSFTDGTARNNPVGTFPGSHNKHVVSYSKDCSVCHLTPATETIDDFNHRNGYIQMATPINGNTGATYSKGSSFLQINTFAGGTCSNTYCHSNGTPVSTGTIPANTSPTWGGSTTCGSCHGGDPTGRPAYTNGTPKANSHQATTHAAQTCDKCHYATTTDGTTIANPLNHANGIYNVTPNTGAGISFAYTFSTTGGTCSSNSCHGNVAWGGTLGCVDCHAVAMSSPVAQSLDSAVTQRRAIVPEFQLASNHVRNKTGGVTNADCGVCHMEGNASDGSINVTYHKNGYVELRDPDTGTTIKQAQWSGTGAGGFSSTANDARFVRFSRNLSAHLEADASYLNLAGVQLNHCLKCHDSAGAGSTLAMVTGGTATNPFNATAGGIPSGRVVDVYSQFATTNRAYHPVLGKQNNSYAAGTRMNAPWNITKTAGTTTSWGYLMTCWDCHAPNAASGILTSTVTAHGSAITSVTGTTNNVELRGYIWRTGAVSATNNTTLCIICHAGYDTQTASHHGTGSALASGTNSGMTLYMRYACYYCHSAGPTEPNRPIPAADVHGYNTRSTGANFSANNYGYAFIRSEGFYGNGYYHSVANVGNTIYTAECTGFSGTNGSTNCARNNMGSYTPGGVY